MGLNFRDRFRRMDPIWDDFHRRNLSASSTKGFIKTAVLACASPGAQTCTGIRKGDELLSVLFFDASATPGAVDSTSDFWTGQGGKIVAKDDTINNTGGTSRATGAGKMWIVFWIPWEDRL